LPLWAVNFGRVSDVVCEAGSPFGVLRHFPLSAHVLWVLTTKGADKHMLNRIATLAVWALVVAAAPVAAADDDPDVAALPVADPGRPAPDANVAPPPDNGVVPSGEPGIATTPDGRTLTVSAKDETLLPVPPLTTAVSSREYLVGGTFTGSVRGSGSSTSTGGTLEVGYQIGCGIIAGKVKPRFTVVVSPSLGLTGLSVGATVTGLVEVELKPGSVTAVLVDKKTFQGTDPRVIIGGFRIKVDGCEGQSFVRSYATLTSSTQNTDDVVSYLGVTKVV
jgi:MspA